MSRTPSKMYDKLYKRTINDTKAERDLCYGRLRDYGDNHTVRMFWDLSPEAKADRIFKLQIGEDEEQMTVYIDGNEMNKFLRWV